MLFSYLMPAKWLSQTSSRSRTSTMVSGAFTVTLILWLTNAESIDAGYDSGSSGFKGPVENITNTVESIVGFGSSQACYGDLGCFSTKPPWFGPSRPFPLPMTPQRINTHFFLFTRKNSKHGQPIVTRPKIHLEDTKYDANKSTIICVHGFAADAHADWMEPLRKGLLRNVDANVFLTDWGDGARMLNYLQVASNTRVVGAEIARLAKHLVSELKQSPKRIHCIGHSLGAHACGYMGKIMKENQMKIDRITGLDPAGPGFELTSPSVRLNRDDADFIDVYHTDAKPIIPFLGFGIMSATGHVDFYMNGGMLQPGCVALPNTPRIHNIMDLGHYTVETLKDWIKCPHSRAPEYFIASLSGCVFVGSGYTFDTQMVIPFIKSKVEDCPKSSKKCAVVGLLARLTAARGSFFAVTSDKKPYCMPLTKSQKTWLEYSVKSIEDQAKNLGLSVKNLLGRKWWPWFLPKWLTGAVKAMKDFFRKFTFFG